MNRVTLSELLTAVQGTPIRLSEVERTFLGVSTDSRRIQPGEMFWALRGERHDGHDFIAQALERGAIACVVNRNTTAEYADNLIEVDDSLAALQAFSGWYRRRNEALVIGITGSVGKTTTREMLFHVLSQRFHGIRSRANFNNEIGLPLTLLEIESDHEFAVIELGARHVGDIARLCEIAQPEVGVITAVAEAHLETFGSLDRIRLAKGELFEALPPEGFGILAGDPAAVAGLSNRALCPILRVGTDVDSAIRATHVEFQSGILSFQVDGLEYKLPVPGRHLLNSALCAIGVAREIGMSPEEIQAGLAGFQPVEGRANFEQIGPWTVINDCYNASPASMKAACELLRDVSSSGKRILVAGDMLELGADAQRLHHELGRTVAEYRIDRLIAFGSHAADVVAGAVAGGLHAHQLAQAAGMETVCLLLDCWLEPGDVVLIKGSRGMQMERVIVWLREQSRMPALNTNQILEVTARNPVRAVA